MIFLLVFPWLLAALAVASVVGRATRLRDAQAPSNDRCICGRWIASGSVICDDCIDRGR